MKFSVKKTKLEKAVKNICRVINNKNALPILGDIRFSVNEKDKVLTILGGDSEIYLSYLLCLETAEGGGEFCVSASYLSDALVELKEQPLEIIADIEHGTDAKFVIRHEKGQTVFPLESADEYPTVEEIDEDKATLWQMTTGTLKRSISRSLYAMANDDLRVIMNSVFFDVKDDHLNIVASNGHVLSRTRIAVDSSMTPGNFVMPRKTARLMTSLLATDDMEDVTDILFNERMAQFESDNMKVQFVFIEGKYPNYESVIPDGKHELTIDRQELLSAIRNVGNFTPDSSRFVRLDIYPDQRMILTGEDCDFSKMADDSISIESEYNEQMSIGLKSTSLIDTLKQLSEPTIMMRFTEPSRAITIVPVDPIHDDEEITMLLMPMVIPD